MCYVLKVALLRIFPLGHPVEITSDDTAALDAAAQRWPEREEFFDVEPLRFAMEVSPAGTIFHVPEFVPAADGFLVNCGPAGGADFDVASRTGRLRSDSSALELLLETLVLTALDWTFFIGVHAACVMREGRSVLFCGHSQAGKSTLAYACARADWTFVSDNALHWSSKPWNVLVSGSGRLRLRDGARAMFSLEANEVTPREHGMQCSTTAPAGPLVFLQRRPGPAAWRPSSPGDVMKYLAHYDTRPDRAHAEERYRALLQHGAWLLEYEDVWDAVRVLEKVS